MARLARPLRSLLSPSSSFRLPLVRALPDRNSLHKRLAHSHVQETNSVPAAAPTYISEMRKSAFECRILRLIQNEIASYLEILPPIQPVNEYASFIIDDQPGELWITLKRKYGDNEDITIKANMLDEDTFQSEGDDAAQLLITMFVSISKRETGDVLEFLCLALPCNIEIRRVYTHSSKKSPPQIYSGPEFEELGRELQAAPYEYLRERGVSPYLAVFLNEYRSNKNKTELIRWLGTLKSFIEKKR